MKRIIGSLFLGASLFIGTAAADVKPAPKPTKPAPKKEAEKPVEKPAPQVALVDINSATQQQLEALPGVGKAHCHHIINGRPYEKKEDLVAKGILPEDTYKGIESKIIAKAPPKPAKKTKN